MKNKFLIVQPHSDDAILSCSSYIFDDNADVTVLTLEKDEKRLKEDDSLYDFINVKHINLSSGVLDGFYSDFFKTYGRTAILTEENVREFYYNKIGKDKIDAFLGDVNDKVQEYKELGYTILFPLGIGHPFHKLITDGLKNKTDVIFYRDFPHSIKRKAQQQFQEALLCFKKLKENSEQDTHDIKFKIAQKFYKTQSGFFFYEQANIKKNIPEEFYTALPNKKKHIQIYVISKERPKGKTFDLLNRGDVDYKVVVEPQDEQSYLDAGHKKSNLVILPENDRGFSYTVNHAKNLFDGKNPLVIMDDDIMNFFYSIPNEKKCTLSMKTKEELRNFFETMSDEICDTDFEIGTIGKSAFDWNYEDVSPRIACEGSKYRYSGLPVVIIINSDKLKKFDFDETLYLKSDTDYVLKCMYLNIKYAKFVHFLQQTKMNKDGKQKGGLAETYNDVSNIIKTHEILLDRWKENIVIDEKKKKINGVNELRIKYKLFNPTPVIINEIIE